MSQLISGNFNEALHPLDPIQLLLEIRDVDRVGEKISLRGDIDSLANISPARAL